MLGDELLPKTVGELLNTAGGGSGDENDRLSGRTTQQVVCGQLFCSFVLPDPPVSGSGRRGPVSSENRRAYKLYTDRMYTAHGRDNTRAPTQLFRNISLNTDRGRGNVRQSRGAVSSDSSRSRSRADRPPQTDVAGH